MYALIDCLDGVVPITMHNDVTSVKSVLMCKASEQSLMGMRDTRVDIIWNVIWNRRDPLLVHLKYQSRLCAGVHETILVLCYTKLFVSQIVQRDFINHPSTYNIIYIYTVKTQSRCNSNIFIVMHTVVTKKVITLLFSL